MRVKMFIILLAFCAGPGFYLQAGELNHPAGLTPDALAERSKSIDPGAVELTIKGRITRPNPAFFDLDTFMELKSASFETANHWTGKKEKYTGVSFMGLLEFLGLDPAASAVEVIASNDYKISIKIEDLKRYDYLLAYQFNDQLYSQLDPKDNKGPIAIAIHFDKHPELDWEIYKHQLVWFVETIIVK